MYVLAVLLTPVAVVMLLLLLLLLLLLQAAQPKAPIIIVYLHCTYLRLVQESDDEQDEDYWHTPVQETQHPQ